MAEQLGNDFETTLTAAITTAGQTTVTVADSAPSFHLPFADLGAGVVDLTESIGGITPTFTRASTATTTDFAGTVVGVASGEPRSYYDPTTLQYQGYLSEAARTNLCLQSEDLSTTWSVSGANSSVSTDAAVAPDGRLRGDKLVEDSTAAAQHFIVQSFTKAASATAYAVSIWAKAAGRNFCGLRLDDGAGNGARCDFTLTGGGTASSVVPLGTPFTALSATITAYPNGWYRCTLLATSNTATALRIVLNLESAAGTISYDGDGSSGVYFWGGQLEAASFGSSYIPTTTGSVTRNADALTYPATGGWFDASVGTMYVECTPLMLADSTQYSMVFHPAATSIHRIALLVNFIPQTNFLVLVSSVTQASINTGGYTPRQVMRVAGAYAANDFAAVKDGGTVGTDNAGSIPTIDTLSVGSFLGGAQLFGAIRHAYYFPVRLTDAEIQSITAAGNVGPPEANFRIRIDDELILVTSYLGPTLTMTRGIENTLATTHANAAPVFHVLTKGGLDTFLSEGNVGSATVLQTARNINGTSFNGSADIQLPILQNSQSAAYTLVATDAEKHILHPSADTTARTFTIPANSSVAYAIGTAVTFVNQDSAGVLTIAITTDTMRLAGAGTTGSRTLAANGVATALKITSTEWIISGTGLT